MSEIFLSYASQDRETAEKLAALLTSAGWTVWWDRRIPAGRAWAEVLEEALGEMRCMVVLWSRYSVKSRWVKEEAEEGRTLEKLVPVLIDSVKPPVGFRAIQAADLIKWDGSNSAPGARQLIADLESLLGKPDKQRADGAPPDPKTERGESSDPQVAALEEEERSGASRAGELSSNEGHQRDWLTTVNWRGAGIGIVTFLLVVGGFFLWSKRPNSPVVPGPPAAVVNEAPAEPAPKMVSLAVRAPRNRLRTGETMPLSVYASYADGAENRINNIENWEISPEKSASIDVSGAIKALEAGTVKVVARHGTLASDPWILTIEAPQVAAKSAASTKKTPTERAQPDTPAASFKPPEASDSYANEASSRRQLAAYLTRAKTYRVQGNYTGALTELERARAIDPANSEVRQEIEQTRKACNAEKSLGYAVRMLAALIAWILLPSALTSPIAHFVA